jgi:hypothetical protein
MSLILEQKVICKNTKWIKNQNFISGHKFEVGQFVKSQTTKTGIEFDYFFTWLYNETN